MHPIIQQHLGPFAGAVTILVAFVHLIHPRAGFPRLLEYLQFNLPLLDPRPLAFSLAGVAMITGVLLVWNGLLPRTPAYRLGMVMMVVFLVGYVGWHLTGHGGFWPYIETHHHGGNPVTIMVDHLRTDRWAQVSKSLEIAALALMYLAYRQPPDDEGS